MTSEPTRRGVFLVADDVGLFSSTPKPSRSPGLRRTSTVGLADIQIERRDLRVGGRITHPGARPLTYEETGPEIVGREGRVGRVDRFERRIERDHQKPRVTGLLDGRTIDDVSDAVMRMPFAPSAMQVSIACTWVSWSPSIRPAKDFSSIPSSSAFAVAPSFIFTKKGVGVGLA